MILIPTFFWSSTFLQLMYFCTGYPLQQAANYNSTQNRLFNQHPPRRTHQHIGLLVSASIRANIKFSNPNLIYFRSTIGISILHSNFSIMKFILIKTKWLNFNCMNNYYLIHYLRYSTLTLLQFWQILCFSQH